VRSIERPAAGADLGLADALVLQQGANYALAKRLQQCGRWLRTPMDTGCRFMSRRRR